MITRNAGRAFDACYTCRHFRYVKPFAQRQKNDAADAAVVAEAVQRPNMHCVAVKSAEHQIVQQVDEVFTCRACKKITEMPAPSYPIARGRAEPHRAAAIFTLIETCELNGVDTHA